MADGGGSLTVGGMAPEIVRDLEALARERGRALTLDEAVRLRDRAEAIRRAYGTGGGPAAERDGLLPRSVRVGAATLRQLSIGARMTLRRAIRWNEESPELYDQDAWDTLEAYVFAHSHDAEALGRLSSPAEAARVALEWGSELAVDAGELRAAIGTLTDVEGPPAVGGAGPADEAALADSLARRYGGDPMRWLFGMPEAAVAHLVDAANANERAAVAEAARMRGELPPAAADDRADAVAEYSEERQRIAAAAPPAGSGAEAESHG